MAPKAGDGLKATIWKYNLQTDVYAWLWASGRQTKLAMRIFRRKRHKDQRNIRLNKENGGVLDTY